MTRREALVALLAGPLLGERFVAAQEDLTSLTIAQASVRLASREITPVQLANAYLARIAKLDADLNAYITVTRDLALREARDAKTGSPLYGIPIAHKDLLETRGVLTTAGSLLFEKHIPDTNATIVQQLEDAGAVLLGKTNTHELGGGVTTINPFYGTTRNPIDRTRIPGGSSGGSAVAVAARLCLAATGSDTGGSVRIPAAFCGIVGFKPTHGRISTQGLLGASPSFDHVGFLTRTVEDMEIVWRALGTPSGVPSPSRIPPPSSSRPPSSGTAPPQVRVGVPAGSYFFDKQWLTPDLDRTFSRAIAHMGDRGARIVSVKLPIDDTTMARVFDPVFMFELWGRYGADWRKDPGLFSKEFSSVFAAPRPSVTEFEAGLAALKAYQEEVDATFNSVDVIATATVNAIAPPIAGPIDGMHILRNTWPFNAAGTPAISIPIAEVRRGGTSVPPDLPVGLQLIARRGEDDKLLQIARAFFP